MGVAPSTGEKARGRSTYDYGYNVVLVVDAMTDRDADAHRHSIEKIFPGWVRLTIDNALKLLKDAPTLD
jgi:hypothetical protein